MLMERGSGRDRISAPEFTAAADGPASTSQVITFGLVCTRTQDGAPAVVCIRTEERHGPPTPVVEVLAANRDQAAALSDRLRTLIEDHDVLRGQVISFGVSENYGNELVTFLPRPEVSADDVILPTGLLPAIERHVLGVGDHADRLRHNGIHLKRGLLLHGPPGTGKTHTVRYLMGRATDSTVIVLSGASLHLIGTAAALARRLAPTVVVVEDVDLVGSDRSFSPTGNPVLFTLLDAMDGVASDADVTFILTTNRAEDLEEALIQRPGRVDLAVEIPRPDASGRRQLLGLYAGRAAVTADLEPAVRATEGATASALKELMRRAVLAALIADPHTDQPTIDDEILAGALEEFTSEAEALSRSLVGAGLQV